MLSKHGRALGSLLLKSIHNNNNYLLQRSILSFIDHHHFTESPNFDNYGNSLPDPHALINDPNDPNDPKDPKDNEEDTKHKLDPNFDYDKMVREDVNVTDELFVEGMMIAMEEWCPAVNSITDEEKQDMVNFVKKHKDQRENLKKRFS